MPHLPYRVPKPPTRPTSSISSPLQPRELRGWLADLAANPEEIGPGWLMDGLPENPDWIPDLLPIDPETLLPYWWPDWHPTTGERLTLQQRQTWFLWDIEGMAPMREMRRELRAGSQRDKRRWLARYLCQSYVETAPWDRLIPDSL